MFGFFRKDKQKALKSEYEKLLKKAMEAQRKGDIRGYSMLMDDADLVLKRLDTLKPQ